MYLCVDGVAVWVYVCMLSAIAKNTVWVFMPLSLCVRVCECVCVSVYLCMPLCISVGVRVWVCGASVVYQWQVQCIHTVHTGGAST